MKDTLNDHQHVRLSYIFKEKEKIEARIGDFDIDYTLDEEAQANIVPERTWEAIGKPTMIPSLGGTSFFIGKPTRSPDTYDCQWNFDRGRL